MGLFKKKEDISEEGMQVGQSKDGNKKHFRQKKKSLKAEGYGRKDAKRLAKYDDFGEVVFAKGGKTSSRKTKHRAKTTNGRHQGY
jgi:hypothetical protein